MCLRPSGIPAESEMSRQNRATPPQNQGVAPFSEAPCRTFLSFAAVRRCGGLEEGYRGTFGRLANGYFVNGYFEFQFLRETHILGELEGCLFLPEGSSLSLPFSPLVVAFYGLFTDSQSTRLQSTRLRASELLGSENGSRYKGGVAATVTPIALLCATPTRTSKDFEFKTL